MKTFTSITDTPVSGKEENLLGIEKYAEALSDFLTKSATPLTIGIQGQWGTGKTSLMNIILEDIREKNIAVSWVNTWEFSLFKSSQETTPGVLRGMLENLKQQCGDQWTISDESDENLKKVFSFIGNISNQVVKNYTSIDVKDAANSNSNANEPIGTDIAQLKKNISSIIQQLIDNPNNKFEKVVFFLDDLDRIDPPVAVELLEALKNIFDIKNCVFILAIDYDVVIKGLEKKFGPKTDENEREFRSFFDKIIQVPFSMPIGVYKIENLIEKKFEELDLKINEENKDDFKKMVSLTVGYIPRSIKRYINTYSLLKSISNISEKENNKPSEIFDFCLFGLIGIQISYPSVFRIINKKPDFVSWDANLAQQYDIKKISDVDKENKLTDEYWEQFLFTFCQKDKYLQSRAYQILEILNTIREKITDDNEENDKKVKKQIQKALKYASITTVDDSKNEEPDSVDPELRAINRKKVIKLVSKLNEKFKHKLEENGLGIFKKHQPNKEEIAYCCLKINDSNKKFEIDFQLDNKEITGYISTSENEAQKIVDQLKSSIPNIEKMQEKDDLDIVYFYYEDDISDKQIYKKFEEKSIKAMEDVFSANII